MDLSKPPLLSLSPDRGEMAYRQTLKQSTEEPEQVWRPVDLRHGGVGVVGQDICILRPFKLVEKLCSQHDIKVLSDTGNHLVHSILPEKTFTFSHLSRATYSKYSTPRGK